MAKQLILVGVDFHRAPLDVREELSFTANQASELLPALARKETAAEAPATEAMLLATCNRTEFYMCYDGESPERALLEGLRRLRPRARALHQDCYRYVQHESAAARHLFAVAAGIRSQVLGDTQIVAQIKQAYQAASSAGTLGPVLNRTVACALRAAKRARRECGLGTGAASVGAAVLRAIRNTFPHGAELRMLVLGGGEAGQDIARHLAKLKSGTLSFATRRPEQAEALAHEFRGRRIDWREIGSAIQASDVVVSATAAPLDELSRNPLSVLIAGRQTPLLIADVGVPRNADPELARLPQVRLLNLDALQQESAETLAARRRQVPAVESILDSELESWIRGKRSRGARTPDPVPHGESEQEPMFHEMQPAGK